MSHQGMIFLALLFFVYLLGDFQKLKGMEYPLLRILVELIGIILILVVILHKKEILDPSQKKIEEYFKKIKKNKI